MTVYKFDDPIVRAADDPTPLFFEWLRASVTPVVQVAFDNTTFVAIQGSVTEITLPSGPPRYRIDYHQSDRLPNPGIITYRIEEGGDIAYLELRISSPQKTPEPVDIASLASLIQSIGPRRVKTKDMEIEAQSPEMMQRIMERNSPKPVGLGQMRADIVSPKGSHWCYKE